MGRLFIILGIAAIIGSVVGMSGSIMSPIGDVLSNVSPDAIEAQAEALCNDGETLETTQGPETYSPTTGWGRPTYFYCVNADGERREVTNEFGTDLIENTTSTVFSAFSGAMLWAGVSLLGTVLLIIGVFMIVRGKSRQMTAQAIRYSAYNAQFNPNPQGGNPVAQWGGSSNPIGSQPIQLDMSKSDDLADRLQKLENMRASNLISQEEYDRLRQSILNQL